ncbi:MAG: pseudouridine synthase [Treponema sp.]|nr:pseudouridine synthase [Treponema sp.]
MNDNLLQGKPVSRILYHKGFCPLRGVPSFLKNHQVLLNGERIFEKDTAVLPEDEITIDGKILYLEPDITFVMDKPKGFVCSRVSDRRKTVYSLLSPELQNNKELHTVGRLDADTTGLLIFTTNGSLSNYLTDPKNHIEKEYLVTLETPVTEMDQKLYISKCKDGLYIPPEKKDGDFTAFPKKLYFTSQNTCHITLTEGRFHEVRRIFQALGNTVIELRRLSMGPYSLESEESINPKVPSNLKK